MGAAVSRKLWSAALVLGLVAVACGSKAPLGQPVSVSFIPQTVDFLDDVGRGLSLALDKEGNPHLTYIGLIPQLKPGEIPPARPVTAPALPAVLTSDRINGIWSHGAVVQTDITKPNGKKVPVGTLDATATAVDGKDVQHVVWTETRGLWYSSRQLPDGQFSEPVMAVNAYVTGPSIAVDADGVPWAAYYVGSTVQVAHLQGESWATEDVATVGQCGGCPAPRTAIAVTTAGPIVAYTDPGTRAALVATNIFGTWKVQQIQTPTGTAGGFGIAMALDTHQNAHVSFATEDGRVFVASESAANVWQATGVGQFEAGSLKDLGGGTAVAVDPRKGTEYVAWADPSSDQLQLVNRSGTSFQRIPTPGAQNGELPAAAVSSGGKLFLAWYDAEAQDLLLGTYPERLGLYAEPSPIGSASQGPGPGGACTPTETGTKLTLVGQSLAFDTSCIGAPAGKPITIVFDNKDPDTQHNVEVFTNSSATDRVGGAASATDVIVGPASTTYQVPALQPGNYFYRCDVHPTSMTGTLVIK